MRDTAAKRPFQLSPVGSHTDSANREKSCHRLEAFNKEELVKQMQSTEPCGVVCDYDLTKWFGIEDQRLAMLFIL